MKRKKMLAIMLAGALGASVLTAGCSTGKNIDQEAVVAILGDNEIKLGLANFMARYQQAGMDDMYRAYFGDDVWTTDKYGDTTMEKTTKDSVMDNIELMYLLEEHMSDYGVEITDDEAAAMKKAAADFMESNTQKAINQLGATEDNVVEMLRLLTIQSKMQNAIKEEADKDVSDEEAAQKTFSYVNISKKSHVNDAGETVEYTDEELEELSKTVDEVAKNAKDDFDKAMSDANYTVNTHSCDVNPDKDEYSDDETMDDAVIEAVNKLSEGEVSGVIDVDTAYYIVRLDSENDAKATQDRKDAIITKRQNAHYTEVTDAYKEDAKWEVKDDVWKTVSFDTLFTVKQENTDSSTDISE